jgi:hypothetical protein
MNAIPFDTLKMARKLEAAGFPGPQAAGAAEAMAEAMSGAELATKADLLAAKADLLAAKTDLQREIAHETGLVRIDLEREIGHVRTDMTAMETRLATAITGVRGDLELMRRDVELVRRDLTIRLGAMAIASTGVLLTAMRFMSMQP